MAPPEKQIVTDLVNRYLVTFNLVTGLVDDISVQLTKYPHKTCVSPKSVQQYPAVSRSVDIKTPCKVDVLSASLAWRLHEIHIQHCRRSGKFEVGPPDPKVTQHGTNPINRYRVQNVKSLSGADAV